MADEKSSLLGVIGPEAPAAPAEVGVEAIAPRSLVPSERERERGVTSAVHDFATPSPEKPKSIRQGAMEYLRNSDPRNMGGPVYPLIALGLVLFIGSWDDAALQILLPEIRADFGVSLQFLITLSSVIFVVSTIIGPAMGYLADRVSRVMMLRIGALIGNVSSIIQGTAGGGGMLAGGRAISGVGKGIADPALFPIVTDYYPSRSRARVLAFITLMGGTGYLLGPVVAGNIAEPLGWRFAVVGLGALATVVTLSLFFVKEPVRGYQDRLEMGASEEVAQKEQAPISWGEAWRAARSITTLRRLWYATPILQLTSSAVPVVMSLYFAQEFSLGPRSRSYIATAISIVGIAGLLVAGPVADRLLARKPGRVVIVFGGMMLVYSVALILMALSGNIWISIAAALPLGFAFTATLPALYALISLVVPSRMRGLGLQTIAPWILVGHVLNVIAIAPFIDELGLRSGMLLFVPLFLVGAIVLMSASQGVDRDIRAARAASMADEEARQARARRRNKMIICRDVDVTYDGAQVIFNLDFDVEEGEIVALLGTNGAGKSTLIRAIAGLQEASNGAIFLDGKDITHVPPHENARNGIVVMPGGQAIFPTLTVEENLRTAGWMYREDEEYVRTKVREILDFFPILGERLHQLAGNLSGGEQQMVALGQALLMKPRLLMIDELSLGLAPTIVEDLLATLRTINEQGTTVILVEQSLNVAATVAERAVFMEKGEIRFDGAMSDLMRRPELVRAVFMGGAIAAPTASLRAAGPARQATSDDREQRIAVEDVSVRFGGILALEGVSLQASAGEIVGIIGPNGAGKTTLFDAITGYVPVEHGRVLLGATNVTSLTPDARARLGLGRSFQNTRLFSSMTVRETIAVAFENHLKARSPVLAAVWAPSIRRTESSVRRRVEGLIEILGLGAFADKFVGELSTGTRRAVEVACVMASRPQVLLLDEPSSGLAQAETEELGPVLSRLARDTSAALIVIEHDVPLITSIADRLIAMELGKVISEGTPQHVTSDERVVSSYLAASGAAMSRSDVGALRSIVGQSGKRPPTRER